MTEFNDSYAMYKHAVESITMCFANKYFGTDYQYDRSDWVGEVIGDVICINDYWLSIKTMIDYMKYGYTKKQMFEHYEYFMNGGKVCIRDWKKLKKQGIIKTPTKIGK